MMQNEEIDNDVNEASTNGGFSSGRRTCNWGEDGRHPATSNEPDTTEEQQRRRKWNKELNIELWKCYLLSNPEQRGYRRRMTSLWHERGNHEVTEQRLADQQRLILKRKWLTETEREEIKRKLEDPDDAQENEVQADIPKILAAKEQRTKQPCQ